MRELAYIVVHCSDSPNDLNDSRNDGAGDIHRWHIERGFAGIGYHYVIDENGDTTPGRPVFTDSQDYWAGAHAKGHNDHSIGICLIGRSVFHATQLNALRKQIQFLKRIWPDAQVVGHRDLDGKKTCPNFNVKTWLTTGRIDP